LHARHCVCGIVIVSNRPLCGKCFKEYGGDSKKWPEWVSFLVKDEQKEIDRERNHDYDYQIIEEITVPLSDVAAHNLARAKRHPEMDFEEFIWSNQ